MKELIAVVDDEPDILELVTLHLKKNGFRVKGYADGGAFLKSLQSSKPELVVLDLMLPDIDGFEVCKNLKKNDKTSHIPVIMLTARQAETDKILGLELGADDFVTKPFSPGELVARVRAVLRRAAPRTAEGVIRIDEILEIAPGRHEVLVSNKKVGLTLTEFKILEILAARRGWVYSRDQIIEYLWGEDRVVADRTIDVHIKNLREKLGSAGALIVNVRGVGYKLE